MVAQNVVFGILAAVMVLAAWKVVTTQNVVRAVLYLVVVLAGAAAQFVLLSAEFIAICSSKSRSVSDCLVPFVVNWNESLAIVTPCWSTTSFHCASVIARPIFPVPPRISLARHRPASCAPWYGASASRSSIGTRTGTVALFGPRMHAIRCRPLATRFSWPSLSRT